MGGDIWYVGVGVLVGFTGLILWLIADAPVPSWPGNLSIRCNRR